MSRNFFCDQNLFMFRSQPLNIPSYHRIVETSVSISLVKCYEPRLPLTAMPPGIVTTTCLPQPSSTWAGFVTRFTDLTHTNLTTIQIKFRLSLQFSAQDQLWHSFLCSTLMIFQRSFKTSIACKVPIYPLSPSSGPGIICVHHQRYFQWCLQY